MPKGEEDMSSAHESSSFSIGQMNQLAKKMLAVGFTPEDVRVLAQSGQVGDVLGLFRGTHKIAVKDHVIVPCDKKPFCPDGAKVYKHQEFAPMKWDRERIVLFVTNAQQNEFVEGNKLKDELTRKDLRPLNANFLDFLLENPHLIPDSFGRKGTEVHFWGTIYQSGPRKLRLVRFLTRQEKNENVWTWRFRSIGDNFYSFHPAAVLVG